MAKIIKPRFDLMGKTSTLTIPASELNIIAEDKIYDNFSLFQKLFKVFGWMKLNDERKFILHRLSGNPFVWQPHNSCGWDPTGNIVTSSDELEPTRAKINAEHCSDELFKSCFKHLNFWDGRGPMKLKQEGVDLFNKLAFVITQNAALGALMSLTAGQSFDTSAVEFDDKTGASIRDLFSKTVGTVKGWLQLLKAQAALTPHLDISGLFQTSDFDGSKYIGDIITLKENIYDSATVELQDFIDEGGTSQELGMSGQAYPLMLVSNSIYKAVINYYNTHCDPVSCIRPNPRVRKERMTADGMSGDIYSIDGVYVVPVKYPRHYTKYLTGELHFAYLTTSGTVNLGSSFDVLKEYTRNPQAGIMIQREDDATKLGMYYFLAHQLFATKIADTDMIAGSQKYAV